MKILLVNDYPVRRGGGVEHYINALFSSFRAIGHETFILTGQEMDKPLYSDGYSWFVPGFNAPPLRKRPLRNLRERFEGLRQARQIIEDVDPDVIHIHNLFHPASLRMLRRLRPTVKTNHDCRPFCHKPPPYPATRLVGESLDFCTRSFGVGCFVRCYLTPLLSGGSPKEILEALSFFPRNLVALREVLKLDRLILLSDYQVELARRFIGDSEKAEKQLLFTDMEVPLEELTPIPAEGERTVLFAGRLTKEKGILDLMDAAERVPMDFTLCIAGDGPQRAEIEARARSMTRPRVVVTGYLPHHEMGAVYRNATVIAVPSIGSEGCPLGGVEALARGRPVVGFDAPGVHEWLLDGVTGYLFDRRDVEGLAQGMTRIMADPDLANRMGQAGMRLVREKFNREVHLAGLLRIYGEAVRDFSGAMQLDRVHA